MKKKRLPFEAGERCSMGLMIGVVLLTFSVIEAKVLMLVAFTLWGLKEYLKLNVLRNKGFETDPTKWYLNGFQISFCINELSMVIMIIYGYEMSFFVFFINLFMIYDYVIYQNRLEKVTKKITKKIAK